MLVNEDPKGGSYPVEVDDLVEQLFSSNLNS